MIPEPDPNFEGALEELEAIVGDLERGEPELSTALAKYERGVRLLSRCYQRLDGAERSVALLSGVDEAGNPLTTPFDATATAERETSSLGGPRPASPRASVDAPSIPPCDGEDDLVPF
jgi:exodeoxyribonuclease VII small subunit